VIGVMASPVAAYWDQPEAALHLPGPNHLGMSSLIH